MIKKVDGLYYLYSEDGKKRLSKGFTSRDDPGLMKRIRQVEHYKKEK